MSFIHRDTNLLILFKLPDQDILSLSMINKYLYRICDGKFFESIIKERYPSVELSKNCKRLFVHIVWCVKRVKQIGYRCKFGNPLVQYNIVKDNPPDSDTESRGYLLIDASKSNELALVQQAFNIDDCYSDIRFYISALSYATSNRNLDMVKYLVETGKIIDKEFDHIEYYHDTSFSSAFERACEIGEVSIVNYLLGHDAMLNSGFNSPIYYAAINGHLDIVKILLNNGVIIQSMDYLCDRIIGSGNIDIAKFIKENYKQ